MRKRIEPTSWIWLFAIALAGTGCNFLAPLLPWIAPIWHLHDRQSGVLLSCLFAGSFVGTLLLAEDLGKTLRIGCSITSIGLLLFAAEATRAGGYTFAAAALLLMGFGLGQLMGSGNLIVGSAPLHQRSRALANVGGAWCLGAVLSPLLTTVLLRVSPAARLGGFALLYLLPLVLLYRRELPTQQTRPASAPLRLRDGTIFWATVFLIYGGIEASIAGWLPTFAARYQMGTLGQAQWMLSIFWCGLIVGRRITALFVRPSTESLLVRSAIASSAVCLLGTIAAPSPAWLLAGVALTGVSLSPIFPLLLAAAIERRLSARVMGVVLASCGLGSGIFLSLQGFLSSAASLRVAMFVPLVALAVLFVLRWDQSGKSLLSR